MYQLLQILTYSQAQQNRFMCPKHIDALWQVNYTEKFSDEKVEKNMIPKIIYGTFKLSVFQNISHLIVVVAWQD